jgi:nicotinate phosphoribosyltransferase
MKEATKKQPQPDNLPPPPDGPANEEERHRQEVLDEALEETFPASDPPSLTEPGP